eukprot:m.114927 g.114927  ORF g.114927 m.114927 type:complete len:622 (+) comp9462_c0_seq2:167-2032(+)
MLSDTVLFASRQRAQYTSLARYFAPPHHTEQITSEREHYTSFRNLPMTLTPFFSRLVDGEIGTNPTSRRATEMAHHVYEAAKEALLHAVGYEAHGQQREAYEHYAMGCVWLGDWIAQGGPATAPEADAARSKLALYQKRVLDLRSLLLIQANDNVALSNKAEDARDYPTARTALTTAIEILNVVQQHDRDPVHQQEFAKYLQMLRERHEVLAKAGAAPQTQGPPLYTQLLPPASMPASTPPVAPTAPASSSGPMSYAAMARKNAPAQPASRPSPAARPMPSAAPQQTQAPPAAAPSTGSIGKPEPLDSAQLIQLARELNAAFKGIGCDKAEVVRILTSCTHLDRTRLSHTYVSMFGENLKEELSSELSGKLKELCVMLVTPQAEIDAESMRGALKGLGTSLNVAIEILCTRNNEQIADLKRAYSGMYNRDLEKDVIGDVGGALRRLLVSQLVGHRDPEGAVDRELALKEAQALHKSTSGLGTDEEELNKILSLRSYMQLDATLQEYTKISGYDLTRVLEKELDSETAAGMKTLVHCARCPATFFAEQLQKACLGAGTDDSTLVRIIVTRAEIDMPRIKEEFLRLYRKTLWKQLKGETSGFYLQALLKLIGDADTGEGYQNF